MVRGVDGAEWMKRWMFAMKRTRMKMYPENKAPETVASITIDETSLMRTGWAKARTCHAVAKMETFMPSKPAR